MSQTVDPVTGQPIQPPSSRGASPASASPSPFPPPFIVPVTMAESNWLHPFVFKTLPSFSGQDRLEGIPSEFIDSVMAMLALNKVTDDAALVLITKHGLAGLAKGMYKANPILRQIDVKRDAFVERFKIRFRPPRNPRSGGYGQPLEHEAGR